MSHEPQPPEKASDVEPDEPRQPDPDGKDDESARAWPVIPGNVGSLDDVPADVMDEGVPTVDDEGM